jgi:class 3 adenylate cyclase
VSAEARAELVGHVDQLWGTDAQVAVNVPSHKGDARFTAWYSKYVRSIGGPTTMTSIMGQTLTLDARDALPRVAMPTLVMHRTGYGVIPVTQGHYLAEHIPGAVFVEVPGSDGPLYWETPELILDHLREFVARDAAASTPVTELATILFTDIVQSTEIATSLGDRDWSSVVDVHRQTATSVVSKHGGRLLKWTGDGILATFPDPLLAIAAADELRSASRAIGISIRLGLHTGRVVAADDDVTGLAVHIAARVMATAGADEIVVSRTVHDLLLGSGQRFRELGRHELKGVEGAWELYALETGVPPAGSAATLSP